MPEGANSPSVSPPKRPARSWALSVCVSTAYPFAVDLAGTGFRQLVQDEDLLRHHVRRPVLYDVLADPFDGVLKGGAVLERDDRHDELAHLRVLHPEGARLVHEPRAYKEVLHLLRAQAVALGFDHGVVAADEVEETLLIAPDRVAGIDHPLHAQEFRGGQGIGAIRLARRLLVAPVAHRHRRAPVDQLARLLGGALPTFFVYDHDLRVRDGLADAARSAVDLLRRQICGTERLGQPVHQVDPGARRLEQPPELVQVRLRYPAAGVGDVALAGRHALGHPRGARGVQDRPEIHLRDLPLHRGRIPVSEYLREIREGPGGVGIGPLAFVEGRSRNRLRLQVVKPGGVSDHDADVAVLRQVRDLRRLEEGVYVHVSGAYSRGGEHRHYSLPGFLQVDADPVTLLNPHLLERGA